MLIVIFLVCVLFLIKKYKQTPKIYLKRNEILINDGLEIEKCDLNYYVDLNKEYNIRKKWYESSKKTIEYPEIQLYIPEQYIVKNDSQNIHDTAVMNCCKNIYKNTDKSYTDDYFFLDQFKDKHKNILEKIQKRDSYITNMKEREWIIVKNTWNSASPLAKKEFINNLEDCLEDGDNLYCPTGVVNRIVSSLYIENPESMPKTKEIFNTEILNRFSILMIENSKQRTRQIILEEYRNILDKDKLENIIDEWYEYI